MSAGRRSQAGARAARTPSGRAASRQPDGGTTGAGPTWKPTGRVAAIILCLALAVRLVYLADSSDYPAFSIPIVDERAYDQAARQWVSGGGVSTQFFWQPFFYPFFLSGVYAVNGGSVVGVKVLQAVLGAMTCALTCALGQRLFGRTTGIIAGVITAFYGPLIHYEASLLSAGWAAFWSPVVLLLFLEARAKRNDWVCLALGAAGALSILTRPTFLPFFLAACLWLAWGLLTAPTAWRRRLTSCAAVGVGFALITTPVAVQNLRVNGHFGFLPASAGVNLYVGNHPDASKVATTVGFEWVRLQQQSGRQGLTDMYDSQSYFYQQTRAYLLADPVGFARRLLWKTLQFINSRELPRGADVYVTRQWSALQTLLTWKAAAFGFPFGLLLPLALVGLAYGWRAIPAPVMLFLVLFPLAIVLVFVTARYRIPLVPVLAILAAAGCVAIARAFRSRRWGQLALTTVGCVLFALAASVPGPFPLEREDLDSETGLYLELGRYWQEKGDQRTALEWYEKEIQLRPESVPARTAVASLLCAQGRPEKALEHYQIALRVKPHLAAPHHNYACGLLEAGRFAEAAAQSRQAILIDPDVAAYHSVLGKALYQQRELTRAADAFRRAVQLAPHDAAARVHLGVVLAEDGDLPSAIAVFRAAAGLSPNDVGVRCLLGEALENAGQIDEAIQEYRATLRIDPQHVEAQRRLDQALRRRQSP